MTLSNVVFHLIKRSCCQKYLKINVNNEEVMCIIQTMIFPSISRSLYSMYMLFEQITVSKGKLATTKKYKNFDIFLRPEALLLHYWQSFNDDALSFLIIKRKWFLCKFAEATIL